MKTRHEWVKEKLNSGNHQEGKGRSKWRLSALALSFLALVAVGGAQAGAARFAVLSDLHYQEPRLGTSGSAFEAYLDQDPKLLKESPAILEAAITNILQQNVDFVLVAGDLTKDGELLNHVRVAQHLRQLESHGIKVFVVPGNHDINNPDAVSYHGSVTNRVPNVSPKVFEALYKQFGYREAIDRDAHSLSYLAEPVPGLWLLAMDSCKYDESKELGYPVVSGRIKPETMAWALQKIQDAKAQGKQVIAMMHHGVNLHFMGEEQLFPDYLVDDWRGVSALLANAGLKVVFTGHYHSQDAAFPLNDSGEPVQTLCDVETGSLVMSPCAFRVVTLTADGALEIQSLRVTEIKADTHGQAFQDYADSFLRERLPDIITARLAAMFNVPPEAVAPLAPLAADAIIANYVGDEMPSAQTQAILNGMVASPEPLHTVGLMLWGFWLDLSPADNQLSLQL